MDRKLKAICDTCMSLSEMRGGSSARTASTITGVTAELRVTQSKVTEQEWVKTTAVGANSYETRLPVVSEQDVQSSQCAELQRSLILAEEGGKDGNSIGENRPQVNF